MRFSALARNVSALALAFVGLAGLDPSPVHAQSARARVRQMTETAMHAYAELDLERAESMLEEALALATREHVDGAELAQVHVSLGVLAVAGYSDRARGVESFLRALEADPTVTPDPMTSTPEVQSAFDTARARSAAGGRATSPRPTPPPGPAPNASQASAPAESTGTPDEAEPSDEAVASCSTSAECGEGERCDDGECVARIPRPRLFLQLGAVGGVYRATSGMLADDSPPSGGDPARYAGYVMSGDGDCDAPVGQHCVRVTDSGIVPVYGARATLGYWLSPRWGLAIGARIGPGGFESPLSFVLLSFRAQVVVSNPTNPRFELSLFLGSSLGQVQVRPEQHSSSAGVPVVRPWARAGLVSFQVGTVLSYRFLEHLGFFVQLDASVFLGEFNVGADVTIGPEIAF